MRKILASREHHGTLHASAVVRRPPPSGRRVTAGVGSGREGARMEELVRSSSRGGASPASGVAVGEVAGSPRGRGGHSVPPSQDWQTRAVPGAQRATARPAKRVPVPSTPRRDQDHQPATRAQCFSLHKASLPVEVSQRSSQAAKTGQDVPVVRPSRAPL